MFRGAFQGSCCQCTSSPASDSSDSAASLLDPTAAAAATVDPTVVTTDYHEVVFIDVLSFRIDWFDSLLSKGLSRVFSNKVQKHQFFGAQLSL